MATEEHDLLHGGSLDHLQRRFPAAPRPWLDLSTGISPYPYPLPQLPPALWQRLPDAALEEAAREAAAGFMGADPMQLVFTAGSQAGISLLPGLLAGSSGALSVAIIRPTYSEHARAWRHAGARVLQVADLEAALDARAEIICLVNPNNPDARRWPQAQVLAAAHAQAARGGWLIVDEAFADFHPECSVAGCVASHPALIVLRSFGKTFGLAGLRLGALLGAPAILAAARHRQGPWPVAGPALEIARQAYTDTAWFTTARQRVLTQARGLRHLLEQAGLEIEGDVGLFVTARGAQAARTWDGLAHRGVYVRRFAEDRARLRFGLPPDQAAAQRLATALTHSIQEQTG
ncbi:MAG: threonine-phosphate decarboxylase [Gammaproteobacteria bacterium]|nr:threonine-phosphate decarboxylase [Gammaproteobacteria bacterium]